MRRLAGEVVGEYGEVAGRCEYDEVAVEYSE